MSLRFMRNRQTGVVFMWDAKFARNPHIEEISAEEAIEYLTRNVEKRQKMDQAREAILNPAKAAERLQKLAMQPDIPTPPPVDDEASVPKKKSRKSSD